jgi:hypothetical protein
MVVLGLICFRIGHSSNSRSRVGRSKNGRSTVGLVQVTFSSPCRKAKKGDPRVFEGGGFSTGAWPPKDRIEVT